MSCQIHPVGSIKNVDAIRRCLFPTDDNRGSENWLQLCETSISPTGDIIAIGKERRLVVLTSKWDSNSHQSQFQITFSDSIHEYDKVKAVLCLPIVGQSQSSNVGPDWCCIMIGFDSGFVRFYTESCEILYEEQLHPETVCAIKCQSQHNPRPDLCPDLMVEELYIQYQSNICVIQGGQLFTHLRNCRSQLARVHAKGELLDLNHLILNPKKLGFQDQNSVNDSAVVGLNMCSSFDHLLTASVCGGFESKYRTVPPNNTLVLAAGSKPFVGYHYALEGGAQPVLSDVAKAVASRLKSALPGWLTGSKAQIEKQMTVAMQPAEAMGCRFGLCDLRRVGQGIVLSPGRKLAAVSDNLGRVLLIDTFRGVVLRIFKGYRDSQCAFIQVPDEKKSKHKYHNRVALFLVIYSGKKGTIEIFSMQQGAKVAAFTASKHSKLLYIDYGLMGFGMTSKSRYVCPFTTVLIDNDGVMKELQIPFHFALAEKNSKRSRDLHLYKKLKELIKSGDCDEENLFIACHQTCSELKTTEIRLQTVEMLLNSKNLIPEISLKCVQYFKEKIQEEPEDDSNNNVNLKILCENSSLLLGFYLFLENSSDKNGNEKVENTLSLGNKELKNLQKLLDLSTAYECSKAEVKVTFSDNNFTVSDFVNAFNLTSVDKIILKPNMDESVTFKLAEVLFKNYITGKLTNFNELQSAITETKLITTDLFYLLVRYWVERSLYIQLDLEREMTNLYHLIYILVKVADQEIVLCDYNDTSIFWSKVRDILADSSKPFPALTAAMLCKTVAQRYENEVNLEEAKLEEEPIEILSRENVLWSILIGKLEDISLLNIVLSGKPSGKDCNMPCLTSKKIEVSLKYVLEHGRGSVSEFVAQWLAQIGINPENIVINDFIYKKSCLEQEERTERNEGDKLEIDHEGLEVYPDETVEYIKSQLVFEHLNIIKAQFPYSLEGSVLLANLCWEYALSWQKDVQDLNKLEAALKYLEYIPKIQIKCGLFCMIWNTHIKIVYESACKLINKVGKLPKERLCRQDTGLSDSQISILSGICTQFLDKFMDVVQESYDAGKIELKFEPLWENGSQPLVELAVQQKPVNYDLLHLHYQLSLVMQMISTFAVKQTKPLSNLFEASVSTLFFTDIQTPIQINWNKTDIKLNSARSQFLLKIISASLETIRVVDDKVYASEHVAWMSKCLSIARLWGLEIDKLKRYQVVQLYNNGFDSLGEELIPAINERTFLGPDLLNVSAKRFSKYLVSSSQLTENVAELSPLLTKYLDSINGEWCAPSSLQEITNLVTHSFLCLEESQPEYKLAQSLLEACESIQYKLTQQSLDVGE